MSFCIEYEENGKNHKLRFSSYYEYVCNKKQLNGKELNCYCEGEDKSKFKKTLKLKPNEKHYVTSFLNTCERIGNLKEAKAWDKIKANRGK